MVHRYIRLAMRFGLILMLTLFVFSAYSSEKAIHDKGILDLRSFSFSQKPWLEVAGIWEYYHGQFLWPQDFKEPNFQPTPEYRWFPDVWKDMTRDGATYYRDGYATLRLKLLLPEDTPKVLDFFTSPIYSASRVYINGELVRILGKVGKSRKDEQIYLDFSHAFFSPVKGPQEIILHISNFHVGHFGCWDYFFLGHPNSLLAYENQNSTVLFLYFGFVLCTGIVSLLLFLKLRSEKSILFFSLFCFLQAFHSIATDGVYLFRISPSLGELYFFLGSFLILGQCVFLGLFFYSLFPKEFSLIIPAVLTFLIFLFYLYDSFIPAQINSYLEYSFIWLAMLYFLYICVSLVRSLLRKRRGVLFFLISFGITFLVFILNFYLGSPFASYYTLCFLSLIVLFVSYLVYLSQRFFWAYNTFMLDDVSGNERKRRFLEAFDLSQREKDILGLILLGKGAKEIGDRYCISPRTVETHTYNIFRKMGIHSRLEVMSLFHEFSHE